MAGYGSGAYGSMPFGGLGGGSSGTCLVTPALAGVLSDPDVLTFGGSGQVAPTGSGGIYITGTSTAAGLNWDLAVGSTFTYEWSGIFHSLPDNLLSLSTNFIFIGATDQAGPSVGLYIAKTGISYSAYRGSPLYYLEGSDSLVQEGEEVSIRFAVDGATGVTYIYITPTGELDVTGHQLKYVMPTTLSSGVPTTVVEGLWVLAGGTTHDVELEMTEWCFLDSLNIPNLRPIADAGIDQAVRGCSIVRLDGTASFDPEGVPVLYQWRLIDAPQTSKYVRTGADGATPSGYSLPGATHTDTFFSATFATEPASVGEVLLVGGEALTITLVGVDGTYGNYVRVETSAIPVGLSGATYLVLAQAGVYGASSAQPTFYPDASGIYKFDLTVFDGLLYSEPDVFLLNVTESPVPRGIIPDLRFLWDYLSDVWGLVDERDRIETFWSAFAQCAAAELLNIWQIDYNKSLRDIQRTFQRKWLPYEPLLKEELSDLSTVSGRWSGLDSIEVSVSASVSGGSFEVTYPAGSAEVIFTGTDPLTVVDLADQIRSALPSGLGFVVSLVRNWSTSGYIIRIYAPFPVTVSSSTVSLFSAGQTTGLISGSGGTAVSPKTYKVNQSLAGLGISEGDLLVVGDDTFRVVRLVNDPSDTYSHQRVVVTETLPLSPSASWSIPGVVTSESLNFWEGMLNDGDDCIFEVTDLETSDIQLIQSTILGAYEGTPNQLPVDHTPVGEYLANPGRYEVRLFSCHRREYLPIDPLVVDVPYLQVSIKGASEESVLRRNVDFFIDTYRGLPCIRFDLRIWQTYNGSSWEEDEIVPDRLWAETTYLDNKSTIEGNFGGAVDFTLDKFEALSSNLDYLSAVRGLWFSYLKGPAIYTMRVGTQILLGLPFAEEAGTIEEIRVDTGATTGSILIKDSSSSEIVRSYTFPVVLGLETNPATGRPYEVGDTIAQFSPIVRGVEAVDYVKDPTWFEGYMQQGVFYEVEKFFKFLVKVDSDAFNLTALSFAQSFIKRIKPSYTFPVFVVSFESNNTTEISTTDTLSFKGYLQLHDGGLIPNFGAATMFDEPRPAGGGWRSSFDTSSDDADPAPVYPTAASVTWGFDSKYLYPEEELSLKLSETHGAGFTPSASSFWEPGALVYLLPDLVTAITWDYVTPQVAGTYVTFRTLTP